MNTPELPSEIEGIPSHTYPSWRPGQREGVESAFTSSAPFVHIKGVPGSGKSLVNAALAGMTEGRVLYLTNTLALMDQLADFGFASIRGRSNYECGMGGDCTNGARPNPTCRGNQYCPAKIALHKAQNSDRIVTNYSYNSIAGHNLGEFDLVICDEAHRIESWISTWLEFHLPESDLRIVGIYPPPDRAQWVSGLPTILQCLRDYMNESNPTQISKAQRKEMDRIALLCRKISHIHKTHWICTDLDPNGATFVPDNVAPYADRKVWRSAKKVILSSASLMPSGLESLALTDEVETVTLPSTFDYGRRPIVYVNTEPRTSIRFGTSEATYSILRRRIVGLCQYHSEHKGIILSHSYKLNETLSTMDLGARLLTHERGAPVPLKSFKSSPYPLVLMSPSIGEGVDLPLDDCRFIIFPKVLFPNAKDDIIAARTKRIPAYLNELAAAAMIQGVDRGMRTEDDWCRVYILDSNWAWWHKRIRWSVEIANSLDIKSLMEIYADPTDQDIFDAKDRSTGEIIDRRLSKDRRLEA